MRRLLPLAALAAVAVGITGLASTPAGAASAGRLPAGARDISAIARAEVQAAAPHGMLGGG